MGTVTPGLNRISFFRGKAFRVIAICLAVIIVVVGVFILRDRKLNAGDSVEQRTARVTRGQLVDSITGSAPVESANRSELSPKVTATLQQINCKEGDQVKKGDVLFVLDNTDALMNIENTENQIAQMQLSVDSTAESVGGLTVNAPFSGQVTGISVKEGENVNKGGALMTLTDVSMLSVTLPFSGTTAKNITVGQKATVYIPDLMLSVDGTVSYRSDKPYTTASGGELYNAEISIKNPGSLTEGMKATAEIQAGGALLESVENGNITYKNKKSLRSDAGGTVTSINVRENEFVNSGDVLVKLENEDLVLTSSTNDIKMESLKSQLEIQQKQLDYYTITAPFDGTVTSMGTANEGDTVKQGELLAVVSDMNHLQFSISIDELDISQIVTGQDVDITAEALADTEETPLTGKVSKIAMEGTSSNGVTTYPVTITVDDNAAGKLKTGMNIDAEIYISNKQNVLMVPLEAIVERGGKSFVYVKGTSGSDQSSQSGQSGTSGRLGQGWQGKDRMTSGSGISGRPGQPGTSSQPGQSGTSGRPGQGWQGKESTTSGSGISGRPGGRNTTEAAIDPSQGGFPQGTPPGGSNGQGTPPGGMNGQGTPPGGSNGQWAPPDAQLPDTGSAPAGVMNGNSGRSAQRSSGKSNGNSYYDGAVLTEVETGISNETYIEIVTGLTEGQEIVLPKTSKTSSTSTGTGQNNRQGAMMGGGMGGGMPGGGMPSGGPGGF